MEITTEIIGIERAALDRWGKGDPQGYLETYADEVTYFDPVSPTRIDGLDAMKAYYAPIAGMIQVARYDMIGALVQQFGPIAVLSFQLISYGDNEIVLTRWNSTAVYRQTETGWKTVHTHWSYIQPEPKKPIPG
jgi:ketosteroid isomerase-like protein